VRARLCVVFLDKGMPLPAKHALIRTRTATLSVTLLTAWATSTARQAPVKNCKSSGFTVKSRLLDVDN
jgi:hypothetical protein